MKKLLKVTAVVLAVFMCINICAFADEGEQQIKILLDGKAVEFDSAPIIDNGRTLVPLRAIFEAMNAEVDWDDATKTVSAARGDIKIKMTIGDNMLYVNGNPVALDVPAKIINSRTMVPVRAISESFGVDVGWNDSAKAVILCDDDFIKRFNKATENTSEMFASGSLGFTVGTFKGTADVKFGLDFLNKLGVMQMDMDILMAKNQVVMGFSNEKSIISEDGQITVGEGINIDQIYSASSLDSLLYVKDDGNYKIYDIINPYSGETLGVMAYINKDTLKLEKIVVLKDVLGAVGDGMTFDKDTEFAISYNTGDTKKIWDSLQQ